MSGGRGAVFSCPGRQRTSRRPCNCASENKWIGRKNFANRGADRRDMWLESPVRAADFAARFVVSSGSGDVEASSE